MGKLVIRLFVFFSLIIGLYFFSIYWLGRGTVDMYYNKLNQEAGSLVLGISRAHDGITPQVLKLELTALNLNDSIVNFAFDKYQSPYGKVYLNGIRKKMKNAQGDGVFILSVSPGSFTAPKYITEEQLIKLDQKMAIGKIENFTENPNYDYIVNCYAQSLYTAFLNIKSFDNQTTHKDGWNEVKLEVATNKISEEEVANWTAQMVQGYVKGFEKESISEHRISNFVNTIRYLKTKGHVIVVRMPSGNKIIALENDFWPNFSKQFDSIAKKNEVPFFDYSEAQTDYTTYDGSHLVSESAIRFTRVLANDIKRYIKENQDAVLIK